MLRRCSPTQWIGLLCCHNCKLFAQPLRQRVVFYSSESDKAPFPGSKSTFSSQLVISNPDHNDVIPTYRFIDTEGRLLDAGQDIKLEESKILKMYREMVFLNTMDRILEACQRQGRISFYAANYGEEALQVGSAAALDDRDLVFGQYREVGVLLWRGFTVAQCMHQCFGNHRDFAKGRQMPVHYGSRDLNFVTIKSVLGTQIPQAPGAAYAFKRQQKDLCVMCFFGEGAASEGDAHAAFNFAAVLECPVIFFCRNNGYAISTSTKEQYRGDGIASRGSGYGMQSVRVDGNDPLAVYKATAEARKVCVGESRPVLIEAMTYRLGDHSTSDNSSEYRSSHEISHWDQQDNPIRRFRKYLVNESLWDEEKEKTLESEAHKMVMKALHEASVEKKASPQHMFEDVYDRMPQSLQRQRDDMRSHVNKHRDVYPIDQFESWN